MSFKDRVAIVTGASRGIGRETALALAEAEANVVAVATNEALLAEVVKAVEAKGVKALAVKADVSNPADADRVIAEAEKAFSKVDILVNNAGITRDGLLMRMKDADWDAVINVNLKGAFNLIRAVSRGMVRARYGRIVNVSSVSGISGNAGQANYSAAKAGLIGLTKTAAQEFASRGITVNAVAPGFIMTDMTSGLGDEVKQKAQAAIPAGRFGAPREIADAIVFLAGPGAAYITGQVIVVDGGMTM